jgi:hypothetical protein
MTAIDNLLAGLFDYAGLYPPASLGLLSASNNYLAYARGKNSSALGRFIINVESLGELRAMVDDSLGQFRISAIVNDVAGLDAVDEETRKGMRIESVEIKCADAEEIGRIAQKVPSQITAWFEVPMNASGRAALGAISSAAARAKIRMGGAVPEAIPSVSETVQMLVALAELRLPFKATAGLHHPVRSRRALTYQAQSPQGTMHGFVNLCCAASVIHLGGNARDAEKLLEEEDAGAWQVGKDAIQWRDLKWTKDQLATIRGEFLSGIGTCSFEEPMQDLERLEWL